MDRHLRQPGHDHEPVAVLPLPSCESPHDSFPRLVGRTPVMGALFARIRALSHSAGPILVIGPPGSGKTVVARTIHEQSCVPGSPFRICDGGRGGVEFDLRHELEGLRGDPVSPFTLCVRNVHRLSRAGQEALLELLQCAVGDNARILVAASSDLWREVMWGLFRRELWETLSQTLIRVPPLRDRTGDIVLLVSHFVRLNNDRYQRQIASIARAALDELISYPWPGNVRELERVVEHACQRAEGPVLSVESLPVSVTGSNRCALPADLRAASEEHELIDALLWAGGNKSKAARRLHISRETLYRRMRRLHISLPASELSQPSV